MNADELKAQLAQLRKEVPDLEFRPPDCIFCGEETNSVDDCFDCENCGLTWDSCGEFLEPMESDKPRCGDEHKPWADRPGYQAIAHHTYRCVLDEGHAEDRRTHRGYRIDGGRYGDTHHWPVTS